MTNAAPLTREQMHRTIMANKTAFAHYNITHIRELIRYLPPKRLELFHTLPFLLHVNAPEFPGFVDNAACAYGIYGFHDSGFWDLALKHFRFKTRDIQPFLAKRYDIRGLYLMGSAGTLAQGVNSDFDYWVMVDRSTCSQSSIDLLHRKLECIESWGKKQYRQNITFFVLDVEQLRLNNFAAIDEESSGSAQKTILKEEFYRTFIMIAGQIPLWTVLPVGLPNAQYDQWVRLFFQPVAAPEKKDSVETDNFIDLGNLTDIDKNECPGAILWQLYKARNDPVKSFLKATLIAEYSNDTNPELPCDLIKKRFGQRRLDSFLVDPYAIMFQRALAYHDRNRDPDGSVLIRECIYLRLCGSPLPAKPDPETPKGKLILNFIQAWHWPEERVRQLENYPHWPEIEKRAYDMRLIKRIWNLFKEIQRGHSQGEKSAMAISKAEWQELKQRVATYFQHSRKKLPSCSAFLKAVADTGQLHLACVFDTATGQWRIYDRDRTKAYESRYLLYASPHLLEALGWILFNGLWREEMPEPHFQTASDQLSVKQIKKSFRSIHAYLLNDAADVKMEQDGSMWRRTLVFFENTRRMSETETRNGGLLATNMRKEYFHIPLRSNAIEKYDHQCYKIAKIIWNLQSHAQVGDFSYRILDPGAKTDAEAGKPIKAYMQSFQKTADAVRQVKEKTDDTTGLDKPELLLDLI